MTTVIEVESGNPVVIEVEGVEIPLVPVTVEIEVPGLQGPAGGGGGEGGPHPDLAAHDALGLATQAELAVEIGSRVAGDNARILLTEKGANNGVATLGADGKVPTAQMPAIAISEFKGTVASEAAMLAIVGERGDWVVRTDLAPAHIFWLETDDPTQVANWTGVPMANAVTSIHGRIGDVDLSDLFDSLGAAGDVMTIHEGQADPHGGYQKEVEKGADSGYPALDGTGKVPVDQLGDGAPTGTKFLRDDRTWADPGGGGGTADMRVVQWDGTGAEPARPTAAIVLWLMPADHADPVGMGDLDWRWEPPAVDSTAPVPPTGLNAVAGDRSVQLDWDASGDAGHNRFFIYQDGVKLLAEPVANTYLVTGLNNGQLYVFEVADVDNSNNVSGLSASDSATPVDTVNPAAPTMVAGTPGDGFFILTWVNSTSPDVIDHEYELNASGVWVSAGTDQTQNVVSANDVAVNVRMRSKDDDGLYSSPTTAITVTPSSGADTTLPSVPAGLVVISAGDTQVSLNWNDATDNVALHATQPYDIQYGTADPPAGGTTVARGTSDALITGLTNDIVYYFRVQSRDSSGNVSGWSATVSATPTAPAGFDPTDITWHVLHDARTLDVSLNDNDTLNAGGWPDDGTSNQDQAVTGGTPTFKAALAAFNNKPGVAFNGDDHLFNDWATGLAQPYSLFVIGRLSGANQIFTDGATSNGRCNLKSSSGNKYAITADTTNLLTVANADSNPHCFIAIFNGASSKLRVDSVEASGTNPGGANASGLRIGANYNGTTNFLNGEILIIGIKNGLFTAGEITDLENWATAYAGTP